jgi:hypothetical protein
MTGNRSQLSQPGVAVEKLMRRKLGEKTLRYEALQTTISVLVDIFYIPNLAVLTKPGFFNTHRRLHSSSLG